jgi:AmmeMemoRadiSam system protein A
MYSTKDIQALMHLARQALIAAGEGKLYPLPEQPETALTEPRACFITLMMEGHLRGCIGTVVARMPLAQEVVYSTYQSAVHDPRFSPVTPDEVPQIRIEISILTPPQPLHYADSRELLTLLRPEVDGVILRYGTRTGTFLPQVWERITRPEDFLGALCHKMGLPANFWQKNHMDVEIYTALKYLEPTSA